MDAAEGVLGYIYIFYLFFVKDLLTSKHISSNDRPPIISETNKNQQDKMNSAEQNNGGGPELRGGNITLGKVLASSDVEKRQTKIICTMGVSQNTLGSGWFGYVEKVNFFGENFRCLS